MIVVTSGCQSAAIAAALDGMLPDVTVQAHVPLAHDPGAFSDVLGAASTWITSLPEPNVSTLLAEAASRARVVRVPNVYFHAFHPDILHVPAPDGSPLGSGAGDYSSALVVYGWKLGWDHERLRASFSDEVYDRLGFHVSWDAAVDIMRERFGASDLDFADWYLPLVRRGTFMLTDNHPTVEALVQLARGLGALFGAGADLITFPWERVIPDGLLATSTVWPVYPPVAARLGVPGGYVWRGADGSLMDLDGFIARSLERYRDIDPDAVQSPRFLDSTLFEDVLGPVPRRAVLR